MEIDFTKERTHLEGIIPAVQYYLNEGWRVDHFEQNCNHDYIIYSPTGSAFRSEDFITKRCSFCDEDYSDWEEGFCNHSDELLAEELNANNLWRLIELEPSLQRHLP